MRYDTLIYFRLPVDGTYNPATGNYEDNDPVEMKTLASVVNTDVGTLRLVYGELKQGSLTIHLQNKTYSPIFDRIRIGDKLYAVDSVKEFRHKQALVVSEVQ